MGRMGQRKERGKKEGRKKTQKAHRLAPSAGRMQVVGYENLLISFCESFASLAGSRTRAISVAESPAVSPPPKAA
jgi:hypothetical protein